MTSSCISCQQISPERQSFSGLHSPRRSDFIKVLLVKELFDSVCLDGNFCYSAFMSAYLAWQNEISGNFFGKVDGTETLRLESYVYNRQGPCLLRFNSSSVNLGYKGDIPSSSLC